MRKKRGDARGDVGGGGGGGDGNAGGRKDESGGEARGGWMRGNGRNVRRREAGGHSRGTCVLRGARNPTVTTLLLQWPECTGAGCCAYTATRTVWSELPNATRSWPPSDFEQRAGWCEADQRRGTACRRSARQCQPASGQHQQRRHVRQQHAAPGQQHLAGLALRGVRQRGAQLDVLAAPHLCRQLCARGGGGGLWWGVGVQRRGAAQGEALLGDGCTRSR